MNREEFVKSYWNYYLVLEDDLTKITRYVTFEEGNFKCYSLEFVKQLLAICAEIDIVCKSYVKFLVPQIKNNDLEKGMLDFSFYLLEERPNLKEAVVLCSDLKLKPFLVWGTSVSDHRNIKDKNNMAPYWWQSYNKVKHQRYDIYDSSVKHYMKANLGNTLNSLAGLFVLLMNMYKDITIVEDTDDLTTPAFRSKLFEYDNWEKHVLYFSDGVCLTQKLFSRQLELSMQESDNVYGQNDNDEDCERDN